jgi:hypothetical protein
MLSKSHCQGIMNNMMMAAVQDLKVAVVVPYNQRTKNFFCIRTNSLSPEKFERMIPNLMFFAISGQHLAEAARDLCERAK